MVNDKIVIHGAREHNLKDISLSIPKDKLVVITGLSGSGKSSLAFDTLYAEGRRRYVESLSSYARQFLGQMDKADVDSIDGLNPAISIDQKTTSHNPRSTVGTVTEINDYLRLLWARVGHPICPNDGTLIERQSVDQMVDRVMDLPERSRIQILAPVIRSKRGEHKEVFKRIQRAGYVRVIVDGEMHEITDEFELDKNKRHSIDIVVDRLIVKENIRTLIKRMNKEYKTTIFLTSHDISDIEKLCKRVIIINSGQVVLDDSMENLKYHYLNNKIVDVKMKEKVNLEDEDGLTILKDKGYNLKIEVDTKKRSITDALKLLNPDNIIDINISNTPLEDIISDIYKNGDKK